MIRRWNETVTQQDTVYHLGDFDFYRDLNKTQQVVSRLNGKIKLIMGNHDHFHKPSVAKKMIDIFDGVHQWQKIQVKDQTYVLSHFPLERSSFDYVSDPSVGKPNINVHGHIHQRLIKEPGYLNVGVEVTEYRPVDVNDLLKLYEKHRDPNYRRAITKADLGI